MADKLDQDFKTIILKKLKDRKMRRKSRKQCGNKMKISVKRKPKKNSLLPKILELKSTICCCSAAKSGPALCNPMDYSRPGFPVLHYLPGFLSDSSPLSQWCYLTILSSGTFFSFHLQSFPTSGFFPMSYLCIRWPKYWSFSFSINPSNISGWFPLGLTALISFLPKGLSTVSSVQFCSVQLLNQVQLFATPWTIARQASLFITNSQSSLKLMFIELMMPSNHLNFI